MGINKLLYILGTVTFDQPWVMTALFTVYYAVLAVYAWRRPVAGLVMYYGTSIMNPQVHYPIFSSLPMAMLVAFYCLLVCVFNFHKISFRFPGLLVLVFVFLITANISTFSALDPALSSQRFEEFNKIFIICLLTIVVVVDRKDYSFLRWGILGSVFFNIMKNLVETQTRGSWSTVRGSAGWLTDSNDWALALAMAMPLFYTTLIMNWHKGWRDRILFTVATLGALLTLTLTSSRGGFLAVATSGLAFLLMDRKPKRAFARALLLMPVLIFYMPDAFLTKVTTLIGMEKIATSTWTEGIDDNAEYTGAERVYFWRVAYEVMLEHPMTGVGWGNFVRENEQREGLGFVAHSSWFQVAAEAGIPGIFSYLLMILGALVSSFKAWLCSRRNQDAWGELHSRELFCGLLAFCVGASFVSRENSELAFLYISMIAILPTLLLKVDRQGNNLNEGQVRSRRKPHGTGTARTGRLARLNKA